MLENFMKTTRMENWIEIEEFPGYHVSDQGRVRGKRGIIKPGNTKRGYFVVRLYLGNVRGADYIHKLVLKAFGPEQPPDTTIDHINRIITDNRIENLRWATKQQQIDNTVFDEPKGSKNPNSKLTESDIPKIRQLISMGLSQKEIGERFNANRVTISYIKNKKTWSHVK
jgi:hypothetical protein